MADYMKVGDDLLRALVDHFPDDRFAPAIRELLAYRALICPPPGSPNSATLHDRLAEIQQDAYMDHETAEALAGIIEDVAAVTP